MFICYFLLLFNSRIKKKELRAHFYLKKLLEIRRLLINKNWFKWFWRQMRTPLLLLLLLCQIKSTKTRAKSTLMQSKRLFTLSLSNMRKREKKQNFLDAEECHKAAMTFTNSLGYRHWTNDVNVAKPENKKTAQANQYFIRNSFGMQTNAVCRRWRTK